MSNFELIVTGPKGNIGSRILQKFNGSALGIGRDDWDKVTSSKLDAKAIIHCAFDLKHSYANHPTSMIDSNILATGRLLELTKKNQIKKFIFISSCAVYGHSSNTSEEIPCAPISINGQVKLINEHFIQEFCTAHGIKYHILRVFNLFGGEDQFSVVSRIQKSVRDNTPFQLNNNGISQRDFIHVDDVCDIILKTALGDYDFPILNIGTGRSTRVIDLVQLTEKYKAKLKLQHSAYREIEYSRADLTLFNSLFKQNFINVSNFLESELQK